VGIGDLSLHQPPLTTPKILKPRVLENKDDKREEQISEIIVLRWRNALRDHLTHLSPSVSFVKDIAIGRLFFDWI
jgi:hypothetical protein